MPAERLSMRQIRDVLRLRFASKLSQRAIAKSLRLSQGAVSTYLTRARAASIVWPLPDDLDDAQLEALLYLPAPTIAADQRPMPDWAWVHRELRRPDVTLALLWEEYRAGAPDGFGYSWFCDLYRAWAGRLKPTMRQTHIAGERLFVDFAGRTGEVVDGRTGEIIAVQIFVAVLGASSFTYAEGDLEPEAARLDRRACPRLRLFRRRCPADGERQSEGRHHQGLLLRADGQPGLRRSRPPLRHGDRPGAALQAER